MDWLGNCAINSLSLQCSLIHEITTCIVSLKIGKKGKIGLIEFFMGKNIRVIKNHVSMCIKACTQM